MVNGLCVATASALMSWAASDFTLSWTHSVEKTQWQESWSIEKGEIVLTQAKVKGSGAGMDPGDGAHLIDGWWVWEPKTAPVPALLLSASGATESAWELCVEADCVTLGETEQAPVKLWSCELPVTTFKTVTD